MNNNITKVLVVLVTVTVLGAALFYMYSLSSRQPGLVGEPTPVPNDGFVDDVGPGVEPTEEPGAPKAPPPPRATVTKPALYFQPAYFSAEVGKTFTVPIMVDSPDKKIIAVTANISFNPNDLEVVAIESGNSVFPIQAENIAEKGQVKITRGKTPPGFSGAGNVASITFKLKKAASGEILFDLVEPGTGPSRIILDDGQGTDVLVGVGAANYTTLY